MPPIPRPQDMFYNNWMSEYQGMRNLLHQDFNLYSSVSDAVSNKNPWLYCNYDDPGVGFPRDCGPTGHFGSSWTGPSRGNGFSGLQFRFVVPA